MIRAVVMTLLRLRIRYNSHTHFSCNIFCGREKRRSLRAVEHHLANAAELLNGVVVEIERDAAGGKWRMLPEVRGSEESLFFGGHGCEIDRSLRRRFGVRPHAR